MNHNPNRRAVLAAAAACGATGLIGARPVLAASDNAVLKRAIPHGGGEMLPVIGLGTSQVFEVGDNQAKHKQLRGVVEMLVEGGGSLIDTASSYGTAEEVIGAIATGTPLRRSIFIATKLEARGGPEAQDEFAMSLKRLQVNQVNLVQLHNVQDGDPGLGFFRELKDAGKTRYIGATTTFKDSYGAMERLIRVEKPDFIEVDCSIENRGAEDRIIPAAAEVDAAVLIALPFGRSSLFRKVHGKPLPPVAKDIGAETWGQMFLKYLLGNPAITAVIPGTDSAVHLQDNLSAGRGPMPDAKQRQELVRYFDGLG